jgi:hypothetical protein
MIIRILCAAALAATYVGSALAHDDGKSKVTLVYDQRSPTCPARASRACWSSMRRAAHRPRTPTRHPPSSMRLQGAIRSQVNEGPVVTYNAGESFSENPGDRHGVSENASSTESARLLAVFVVDTKETTLTTPIEK